MPAVHWVRERDVDLVLADSFSSLPSFVDWVLGNGPNPLALPNALRARAVVSYNRPSATPGGAGETDILVESVHVDGSIATLSVEDKVAASQQPDQAERHRAFVISLAQPNARTVIFAPQSWLTAHQAEKRYDICVSLEAAAGWHRSAGLAWRAELLDQACRQDSGPNPSPELNEWADAVNDVLFHRHGLRLKSRQLQRTPHEGRGRSGRFLTLENATLPPHPEMRRALLTVKTSSARFPARADIEIQGATPGFALQVEEWASGTSFVVRRRSSGTVIVSNFVPGANSWTTVDPISEQLDVVALIADAAHELRTWWQNHSGSPLT